MRRPTAARLLLDSGLDALNVGDGQVVADDLNTRVLRDVRPWLPVVLVKRVLDRDDAVFLDVADV